MNLTYSTLHHLQVGRIGEYWVKLMLTMSGLDTYYSDVDNKAIDFVVRLDDARHIDLQVKTVRSKTGYVFITKDSWPDITRRNLYMALVLLKDNAYPEAYLIPANAWLEETPLLRNREYKANGKLSKDEWGINISNKTMPLLKQYSFLEQVELIKMS